MKVIGRDGWPDLFYYTQTPNIREAFDEANRVLGPCPDRSEYLAVVWVPEPGSFCIDQIDAFAKDAKAGRVKNETSREDRFYFEQNVYTVTASRSSFSQANQGLHMDGAHRVYSPQDDKIVFDLFSSINRRCVLTETGPGTIVLPKRFESNDVELNLYLSDRVVAQYREDQWMVPAPGAVFFNWYGKISHRCTHAAPILEMFVPNLERLKPNTVVRKLRVFDYSA
jgi:hypothetical protein